MFHSKKRDQPLCKMHSFILSVYCLVNRFLSTPAELCLDISCARSAVWLEKKTKVRRRPLERKVSSSCFKKCTVSESLPVYKHFSSSLFLRLDVAFVCVRCCLAVCIETIKFMLCIGSAGINFSYFKSTFRLITYKKKTLISLNFYYYVFMLK